MSKKKQGNLQQEKEQIKQRSDWLFEQLEPFGQNIENFPKDAEDFLKLPTHMMNEFANKAIDAAENFITDEKTKNEIKIVKSSLIEKRENLDNQLLHAAFKSAGINSSSPRQLSEEKIMAHTEQVVINSPKLARTINNLSESVIAMKAARKEERQQALDRMSTTKTNNRDQKQLETEKSTPKKENNRVTFKDAMELKNESIKEKNAEQTWKGNLANRIKGVGRVLYAIPAIPIEGAKGIFNAVRSVPVIAGGALKAAWGAIRGNQELKENGISMMSAGGHMALQGATAFVRAPASLIKEGLMNIATGQRQENTFRAKQQATRLTREKGKGNLDLKANDLLHSSKNTQKIVEKMRSTSQIQQGSHVQQSASTGKVQRTNTRESML